MPWVGGSVFGVFHLTLFTVLVTLALYFYLLCVLVEAGSVPRDYEHDLQDVTTMYIQVCTGALRGCPPVFVRYSVLLSGTRSWIRVWLHTGKPLRLQVKKTDGAARHCNKCERPKPPRAHHCASLRALELREVPEQQKPRMTRSTHKAIAKLGSESSVRQQKEGSSLGLMIQRTTSHSDSRK